MNARTISWLVLAASLAGAGTAHADDVPAACRSRIDARLPGWRLIVPSAEVAAWAKQIKEGPDLLQVDLDADGVRDVAALIVTGFGDRAVHHIAVCMMRKGGPELHVIGDPYCFDGIMIARQGTRAHDFEKDTYVTYRTNGVHAYCHQQAGATYLYRNGRFIRIVDSD